MFHRVHRHMDSKGQPIVGVQVRKGLPVRDQKKEKCFFYLLDKAAVNHFIEEEPECKASFHIPWSFGIKVNIHEK